MAGRIEREGMERSHRFRALSWKAKKKILLRFALLQIPDLLILVLALIVLREWIDASSRLIWGLVVFWFLKDAVTFFFVWPAYEEHSSDAWQDLIGCDGVAEEKLDPEGYIRVHGVLWRARAREDARVDKGDHVVVEGIDGGCLLVRHAGATQASALRGE